MAYSHQMRATFIPGGAYDDGYYDPPPAPELMAPEPQRINLDMGNQLQDGLHNMNLNARNFTGSTNNGRDAPNSSLFPKLVNPPPNVPPSDDELEATLENARTTVLNSNDPDMQLAWAADALVYAGVCADNEERIAAAKPQAARTSTPRIEHQLKVDAMNIVTFLADQHHPKAEFLKGMWLEWGRFGQREDKKEAFRCYSRAADRGYARAEYRIGMLYESYNDPIKALRHYHRGVEVNDAASCYRLGMMTLRGQHGQQQDFIKGLDLIRRSAEAADENAAQGAYVYGMLLMRELPQIDVPEALLPYDERLAKINIEKAAYLKFAKAQLKMGSAYELGSLGCDFRPDLSIHYNALASKQGEAEADMALSKWFLVGSEGFLPKNEELAYTYAERSAQASLPTAEFAMGYFNEIGMYVPTNLDKAMEWYQKASLHGNQDAKGRIEGLNRKQVLNRRDHENVAINKIKSQYGSMRGKRPERFRHAQQPGIGGIAEESYSVGASNDGLEGTVLSGAGSQPSRGTTPYPLDGGPPRVPPNIRPGSAAPYPLQDGPPLQAFPGPRLGPNGGYLNGPQLMQRPATTIGPDPRPNSAFQVNSDQGRSASTQTVPRLPSQGGTPPQPPYVGYPPSSGPPSRPLTASPTAPSCGAVPRPGPDRIVSSPLGTHQSPAGAPSVPRPQLGMMPPRQSPAPTGRGQAVDIGYAAPLEHRRPRAYGAQPGQSASCPGLPPALPHSDSMPNLDAPLSHQGTAAGSGPSSAPPSRPDSRPSTADNRVPSGAAPRPQLPVPSTPPASTPKPSAGSQPAKGPKTFDEMGVPKQKQDGECVIM